MFKEGFVFGKFYPLHLGHVEMIRFASMYCQKLNVIVCGSKKESIATETRSAWIRSTFHGLSNIQLINCTYDENVLANSSVSDRAISLLWSGEFKRLVPGAELLVSSELYGEYLAEYMGLEHKYFDPERSIFPVSASDIRKDLLLNWEYLPVAVQAFFQRCITVNGSESTGKTLLAKMLSDLFPSFLVNEAGRELIPDSRRFSIEDLEKVAHKHAQLLDDGRSSLKPFVVADTDVYITQGYAAYAFGKFMDLPEGIYTSNRADLRFYLDSSVPFSQDGTRMNKRQRLKLDQCHRKSYKHFNQHLLEITGPDWKKREQAALSALQQLMLWKNLPFQSQPNQRYS